MQQVTEVQATRGQRSPSSVRSAAQIGPICASRREPARRGLAVFPAKNIDERFSPFAGDSRRTWQAACSDSAGTVSRTFETVMSTRKGSFEHANQ